MSGTVLGAENGMDWIRNSHDHYLDYNSIISLRHFSEYGANTYNQLSRVINTEMFSDSAIWKSLDFPKETIYRFGQMTELPNKIFEARLKMNQKRLSQAN